MKLTRTVVALFVLFACTLTVGCGYSPSAAANWTARCAVKEKLRSPGSAKFDSVEVVAQSDEDRLYVVYLVVDSQNSYGAMCRNYALALVMSAEDADHKGSILHLEIAEESPSISRVQELTREMGEDWVLADWVSR